MSTSSLRRILLSMPPDPPPPRVEIRFPTSTRRFGRKSYQSDTNPLRTPSVDDDTTNNENNKNNNNNDEASSGVDGEHSPLIAPQESAVYPSVINYGKIFPIWHCKRAPYRWTVLFIACLFSVGSYFTYDSIGVVQNDIVTYFHIDEAQFGLLYSVYSFPNIVLPFFGGFILDYVGLPIGTIITCGLVAIGGTVVALAPQFDSFWMMLAGRFIFGVGAETSYVAQNTICCAWFKEGSQLALAMGFTVSAGRLGSYFTFAANAQVVEMYGTFEAALWLGAIFAGLSFFGGLVYVILHYLALRMIRGTTIQLDIPQSQPDIQISQAFSFKPVFWLAVVVCCTYYSSIFPFQSTATNLLEETHGYSPIKAANLISLLPLTSFFMSPIFGFIVDKVGLRIYFAAGGLAIMAPCFALLMIDDWPPIVSIMLIGLIFSMVPAALWPCIPLLVEEKYIGTSFGLISGVMNACLTLFYWAQGNLPKKSDEVLLFTGLAVVGFILALFWIIIDYRMGNVCNARASKPITVSSSNNS